MIRFCICWIFLSGICANTAFSQDDTIRIFYDENWKEVADPANAVFRRIAFNNDNGFWEARDYYKDGQLQMSGVYLDKAMTQKQGSFEFFYPDGKIQSRSMYMYNTPVDEETTYYKNGQIDTYTRYNNSGKSIESKYYKEDGSESKLEHAEFPGGMKEMYSFIEKNLVYPKSLRKQGLEGKAYVGFVINVDGSLENIAVLNSSHDLFSKEASRVIKAMPKWKPATRDGVPVVIKYNIPINFNLE